MIETSNERSRNGLVDQYRSEIDRISQDLDKPPLLRLLLNFQPNFFVDLKNALSAKNVNERFKRCQELTRKIGQFPEIASYAGAFSSIVANASKINVLDAELISKIETFDSKTAEIKHSLEKEDELISKELDTF